MTKKERIKNYLEDEFILSVLEEGKVAEEKREEELERILKTNPLDLKQKWELKIRFNNPYVGQIRMPYEELDKIITQAAYKYSLLLEELDVEEMKSMLWFFALCKTPGNAAFARFTINNYAIDLYRKYRPMDKKKSFINTGWQDFDEIAIRSDELDVEICEDLSFQDVELKDKLKRMPEIQKEITVLTGYGIAKINEFQHEFEEIRNKLPEDKQSELDELIHKDKVKIHDILYIMKKILNVKQTNKNLIEMLRSF